MLIGGRYELLESIGAGGFATTWRAWDVRLERAVAIKVLRPEYASDQTFVQRFVREARAAASVSHPNVVRLFDFGQDQNTVFIAMQYVQGHTLRDHLRRHPTGLPENEAIRLITPVLRGLAAIHAAGIVHRDTKPDNVLVEHNGEVLITDFGIALLTDSVRLTGTDTTFGTAAYMAPEQGRGEVFGPATDVYSAGVVLYEMLTGRLPFVANNPVAMMMAHQEQLPPPLEESTHGRNISRNVAAAVDKALAKHAQDRFQSTTEFLSALTNPLPMPPKVRTPTAIMPINRLPQPRVLPAPTQALPVREERGFRWWILTVVLLVGIAFGSAAYWAGLFDSEDDPGPLAPIQSTSTVDDAQAPTIAAIDTETSVVETPTDAFDTPTPEPDEEPGIIVSAVPDGTPGTEIEPIDGIDG